MLRVMNNISAPQILTNYETLRNFVQFFPLVKRDTHVYISKGCSKNRCGENVCGKCESSSSTEGTEEAIHVYVIP